ncbi:MAG: tRNA uridine-5-carboxymethylaminomethyl(34) synthesis GTPase MnmE [Bacteroidia bacterium]|jgi:tRNA modification GTPase|nr:tRNA uridine-5-carboxymethylaminomethyl(34) synthesis GTPase MnmE [Bacteroidia bacterium]
MHFDLVSGDTICAISTAPGMGAIAVVRLSGKDAIAVASSIFRPASPKFDLSGAEGHRQYFGRIMDREEVLDEVLVSVFRAPKSYTGENMAEISCHGSIYIQHRIMELLMERGARPALAGEFTMRAFANKKLDLAQAEAVADLIASNSKTTHQLAMKQLRGNFSEKIAQLRQKLVDFVSLIELELDFSEEDVEFADRSQFQQLLSEMQGEIGRLLESFKTGNAIKQGIPVAIIGKPNAGKSTLLNAILNEEKAIVSEIPGTTRDAIEDTIIIGGYNFRFIDTAGLRQSDDLIENIGIERTYEKIRQASIILYVCDMSDCQGVAAEEMLEEFLHLIEDESKHFILVGNKIDMLDQTPDHFRDFVELETIFVSAKRKENIHLIADSLLNAVKRFALNADTVVSNARHYHALLKASESLATVQQNLQSGLPTDLVAIDLKQAIFYVGSITGEIHTEEVLGSIFSKFCIGK